MYQRILRTISTIIAIILSLATILVIIPIGNLLGIPKIRQLLIASETTSDEIIHPWEF